MDIGFASLVLLLAGIAAGAIALATIVGKAVGTKLVARAEAAIGEKAVQALQVVLLSVALSVVCCGTIGREALPMISETSINQAIPTSQRL